MRGVWRACLAGVVLGLGPAAVLLATGRSTELAAGALLAGMMAAFPGLALLQPTLESERFIQGMRRSCGRVQVLEDRLDWRLRRHLYIETPVGAWRIRSKLNPLGRGITVKPPHTRGAYRVKEDPCQAGRVLMARILTAQPVLDEDSPVTRSTTGRSRSRSVRRA